MTAEVPRRSTGLRYSFATGIISVIVCYRIGARFNLFDTLSGWGLGAVLFFVAAISVPLIIRGSNWMAIVAMLGAIPFAVIIDCFYDSYSNHIDRNLFRLKLPSGG